MPAFRLYSRPMPLAARCAGLQARAPAPGVHPAPPLHVPLQSWRASGTTWPAWWLRARRARPHGTCSWRPWLRRSWPRVRGEGGEDSGQGEDGVHSVQGRAAGSVDPSRHGRRTRSVSVGEPAAACDCCRPRLPLSPFRPAWPRSLLAARQPGVCGLAAGPAAQQHCGGGAGCCRSWPACAQVNPGGRGPPPTDRTHAQCRRSSACHSSAGVGTASFQVVQHRLCRLPGGLPSPHNVTPIRLAPLPPRPRAAPQQAPGPAVQRARAAGPAGRHAARRRRDGGSWRRRRWRGCCRGGRGHGRPAVLCGHRGGRLHVWQVRHAGRLKLRASSAAAQAAGSGRHTRTSACGQPVAPAKQQGSKRVPAFVFVLSAGTGTWAQRTRRRRRRRGRRGMAAASSWAACLAARARAATASGL